MAGGKGNPGGIPLGDRTRVDPHRPIEQLHATPYRQPQHTGPDPRTYGETAKHRDLPDGGRHVLVNLGDGPQAGLLVGWRKPDYLPWEGHCWFPQIVDGRWVLADRWILASAIEPV